MTVNLPLWKTKIASFGERLGTRRTLKWNLLTLQGFTLLKKILVLPVNWILGMPGPCVDLPSRGLNSYLCLTGPRQMGMLHPLWTALRVLTRLQRVRANMTVTGRNVPLLTVVTTLLVRLFGLKTTALPLRLLTKKQ